VAQLIPTDVPLRRRLRRVRCRTGRLTNTLEGHLSGGAISGSDDTREEKWTALSQTGNWERFKLDLNADGDFTDTGERDDTGTFNKVNEWLTRDPLGAIRPRVSAGSTMPRL